MIVLLAASSITLTALQASINAPRDAFKTCLKEASAKAGNEKVAADAYDTYVRAACSGQLGSFKSAAMAFDMKNKMSKKDSSADADAMVSDFLESALDNYKYVNAAVLKQAATAVAPASTTPPPTPAAEPK
jgi:predicted secreted acid phosphatase